MEGQVTTGKNYRLTWTRRYDDQCVTLNGDGARAFSDPLRIAAAEHLGRIRIQKRQRPRKVSLIAWTEMDASGHPIGEGMAVPVELLRIRRKGKVTRWVAQFTIRLEERLLLDFTAAWRDRNGCGGRQSGGWVFSLEAAGSNRDATT